MNAGRELDALVAEKVVGWIHLPEEDAFHGARWKDQDTGFIWGGPPPYSTAISVAWKVVEKMGLSLVRTDEGWMVGDISCGFTTDDGVVDGTLQYATVCKTAPLAICLAALKAVGVEAPK
jgi:hypothetical protein